VDAAPTAAATFRASVSRVSNTPSPASRAVSVSWASRPASSWSLLSDQAAVSISAMASVSASSTRASAAAIRLPASVVSNVMAAR
jgi:hypothetical protein